MKKLITLTLLSVALLFAQCKKDAAVSEAPVTETIKAGTETITITSDNQLAVQSVLKLKNKEHVKLGFSSLASIEKYLFWINNIRKESAKYNAAQKALVNEFTSFLHPKHFSSEDNGLELLIFTTKWESKATGILSAQQISALIYDIDMPVEPLKINVADEGVTDCNCNTESPWCTRDFSVSDACGPKGDPRFSCNSQSHCGALWRYTCNGSCYKVAAQEAQ